MLFELTDVDHGVNLHARWQLEFVGVCIDDLLDAEWPDVAVGEFASTFRLPDELEVRCCEQHPIIHDE